MTPHRLRARLSAGSSPNRRALPEVGLRRPSMRLMEVVLPAPFGPSIATTSPGRMAMSTPRTAWTGPKLLWAPISSTAFPIARSAYRRSRARTSRTSRDLPVTSVISLWRGPSLPHARASRYAHRVDIRVKRRLMGLGLSCSYLVFVVVIAIAEVVSSDPVLEKVATNVALALFVAGYIAFWYTSMTDEGWTCDTSWVRISLAVGLWAITLGLCLVHFQVFGFLLIFSAAVVAGIFGGRAALPA